MEREIWLLALGHQQVVLARYQRGERIQFQEWQRETLAAETDEVVVAATEKLWQRMGEEAAAGKRAVVFLVSPFWIKADGNLLENKKALLADLSRRFHLQPLGFLLADEILIRHYQQEHNQTPSFISVALDNPSEISLVHLGKIKSRLRLEMQAEEKWPERLEEILGQLDYPGMFPPHFIFWGWSEERFANLRQECENHVWTGRRDSLFLQIPQFDFLTWPQFLNIFIPVLRERLAEQPKEVEKEKLDEADEAAGGDERAPLSLPAGFSEEDLALKDDAVVAEELPEEEYAAREAPAEKEKPRAQILPAASLASKLPRLVFPGSAILGRIRHWGAALYRLGLLPPFLLAGGFFLGLVIANGQYFSRSLDIILTPQVLTVRKILTSGDISWQTLSVELTEHGQVPTTGQTLVGEKALGTVVIFNRLSHPLLLSSGTHLEADNGLTFSLRESVKVASKTADLNSGIDKLGQAVASVIATKFGPEYNLPQGTIFKIDNYGQDECLARAKDDFAGGSNRQVPAVRKEDLDSLRQQLEKKILARAGESIRSQAGDNLQLVGDKLTSEVVRFDPQRHAGEEAEVLKGQLTMKIEARAVPRQQLADLARKLIREKGGKSELEEESLQTNLQFENGKPVLLVQGKVIPRLDLTALRQQLRGKTKAAAQRLVHHYPRVARLEIHHQIGILNFWPWLPWRPDKIIVRVKSE